MTLSEGGRGDLGTATRSVQQALERTRINLEWKKRRLPTVTKLLDSWFQNQTFSWRPWWCHLALIPNDIQLFNMVNNCIDFQSCSLLYLDQISGNCSKFNQNPFRLRNKLIIHPNDNIRAIPLPLMQCIVNLHICSNSIKALNFDRTCAQWNDSQLPEIGQSLMQIKRQFSVVEGCPEFGREKE